MGDPYYFHYEEFKNRSKKLNQIRALGLDPYPPLFKPTHFAEDLTSQYISEEVGDSKSAEEGIGEQVSLSGRLVLFRPMGKHAFAHLQDSSGRFQLMFSREATQMVGYTPIDSALKWIEKMVDIGDFLGVEGHLFKTNRRELTLYVKKVMLLCKTLLPLPEKHSGLADKELRYRKRWLDLISSSETVKTFQLRSQIIRSIRSFFEKSDFVEVETPILQNIYGGANANPFTTELEALHQKMYLRISPEISLKKLIVGGMDRIYELSKVFRNEGLDRTHNPEFTILEAYAAYWDYYDMMRFTEKLFETVAQQLFGTTKIRAIRNGEELLIDLQTPWKRMSMKESLLHYGSLDVDKVSEEQLRAVLIEHGFKESYSYSRGLLIAKLFEVLVEPSLIQPHHIIDHPIETTPLCKPHRDPLLRKEGLVERFETFILGYEFCNSYTELNDPELQRKLLVEQRDSASELVDEEFLEAICQGMPPTAGLGIGIDRLVMLFTSLSSIRDVLFFPIMRSDINFDQV